MAKNSKTPVKKREHKTKLPTVRKKEVMEELTKIVENGNILGVTQTQLSERFNIRRQTIAVYLQEIYNNIPSEDIEHTRVKIQVMFDKLFREAQKMIATAQDNKERKEAIDLLLRCMDKFTDFLERFNIKEKTPEKYDIRNININIDVEKLSDELLEEISQNG